MYGNFIADTAGYEIKTLNLPTSWEYIYENRDILLKVDQFGPVYAQADPPGGVMLFKREQHGKYAPWLIHVRPAGEQNFTNFFRPNHFPVGAEPEQVSIQFRPECAVYTFRHQGMQVETELFIPNHGTTIVCKFRVKNLRKEPLHLQIAPQLVPYFNEAVMAPWDKYEWYIDTHCEKTDRILMKTDLLSATACAQQRKKLLFASDLKHLQGHTLSLEKYVGQGDLLCPQGQYEKESRIYAYPPVYALCYDWTLEPGAEEELTQILTMNGEQQLQLGEQSCYVQAKAERRETFEALFSKNRICTGDPDFDYYANYWLPLQMNWVASLDRGWPTGMRGTRDAAQDYTALLYTNTEACRKVLLVMLECQRKDGWFPRQYCAMGRQGKHDLRGHVDGGAFAMEFIWKYLAHSQDYDILNERIPWLDDDHCSSVKEHMIRGAEYYIAPENLGEHGLCKIREGDWLDSVNTAGLEGRGESVTVSAQMVMGLQYLADILTRVSPETDVRPYLEAAERLKKNINRHAFNQKGYYNSVFNDNGQWIFSDHDPDGEQRVYGVANYYAIIAGVAGKEKYEGILRAADGLKCDMGYRLFYPYLGAKPIDKVGRISSGDTPPFLCENGNVYNHGSQGFFARALATMGQADRLWDMLRWITPYDQDRHPTEKTWTPPYAIVNCYQQLPGFHHRGLMCFLTGSVAMAMRGVYEWFAGICPCLDGLEICPCVPQGRQVQVEFEYRKEKHLLQIGEQILLDGKAVTCKRKNKITGNEVYFVALENGSLIF